MWHVTWECHLSAGRRCTSIPKIFPMIGSPDLQFTPMQLRGCIAQATISYPEVQHLQKTDAAGCLALSAAQSLSGSFSCLPGQIGVPLNESHYTVGVDKKWQCLVTPHGIRKVRQKATSTEGTRGTRIRGASGTPLVGVLFRWAAIRSCTWQTQYW